MGPLLPIDNPIIFVCEEWTGDIVWWTILKLFMAHNANVFINITISSWVLLMAR